MALARKKSGAQVGAPDKSDQLSRLVARARGRCLAANSGRPQSPVWSAKFSGPAVNQQR